MCLTPQRIPNPYRGLQHIGLNYLHDCTAKFIEVPCGHCASCIALKQSYMVQRAQCETFSNDLWFCTLTYNNRALPILQVNDRRIRYADVHDFQCFIKRLRRDNALGLPFRYFAVTEFGSSEHHTHRPHFHVIFSTPRIPYETQAERDAREKRYFKIILEYWCRNTATTYNRHGEIVPNTRNPIYLPLCTYVEKYVHGKRYSTYDFHYIDTTRIDENGKIHDESDVAFYVTKYALKHSDYVERLKRGLKLNTSPEDFQKIWSKVRPKCLCSKTWGAYRDKLVQEHIRKGIDYAIRSTEYCYPIFFNPTSGQTFPLAPFFKRKFMTLTDAHDFFYKNPEDLGTEDAFTVKSLSDVDPEHIARAEERMTRVRQQVDARVTGSIDLYDDLKQFKQNYYETDEVYFLNHGHINDLDDTLLRKFSCSDFDECTRDFML